MDNSINFRVTPDLYATKGNRFANFLIDYAMRYILSFVLGIAIVFLSEMTGSYTLYDFFIESESRINDYIFGIILILIYYNIIETITSKSIGKYITKTIVVMEDGSKPKASDIFLRTLCRLIPFNAFSFLGEEGKGWHDTISNTYVLDERKFKAKYKAEQELDLIGVSNEDDY